MILQVIKEKAEHVKFLKDELQTKMDEIIDLKDRVVGLQQQKDAEKETYETQLQQLRHEFQETKDGLTQENMVFSGKLASLEEFRIQREELLKKLSDLEEQLAQQDEEHKEALYQLEKKSVIDR